MVQIVEFSDAGVRQGIVVVPMIIKSDEEWRKLLSRSAYDITRKADTEMAFTGAYWNLHEKGLFRCICCDTALFSSETKFDSGTGWPSFWAPSPKRISRNSPIVVGGWSGRRFPAAGATLIWVMCLTTGRGPPDFAIV